MPFYLLDRLRSFTIRIPQLDLCRSLFRTEALCIVLVIRL